MKTTVSINPFTGEEIERFQNHSSQEVETFLQVSAQQFKEWKNTPLKQRASLVLKVGEVLKSKKEIFAKTITMEMGKPISQSLAEIEKCAWLCEYYAAQAEAQLKDILIQTDADKSYVTHEPLGVILAIMPWNYPYWQVFRFAIPSLLAGNVAVLKHASNVFGCALQMEGLFLESGFPAFCFKTLLIGSELVEKVIENPVIKAVTLTGSGPAGASVASIAGKNIKKTVLELGGSNALVVFKDCAIEKTIHTIVNARFQNTGQSCIAGKRLLIDAAIHDKFLSKLSQKIKELKSGDPMEKDTYIGTLAREDLATELDKQVQKSLQMGATLVLGGKRQRAYYEPTLVSGVTPTMPLFNEETFGPALSVTSFDTEEEAIRLSNLSKFGLGVSLFSEDISRMEQLVPRFEEGAVFINELVKSDPRLPFGGIKQSGYGRELSAQGIKEFVNVKTVYIKKSPS
ncbi:MAG: NAD-dependent succinate-semialdehyde dehydrogenase [Flavobacteriaceae bacterium]